VVNCPAAKQELRGVVNLQHVGYRCENVVNAGYGVESRAWWAVCRVYLSDVSSGFPGARHSSEILGWRRCCSPGELVEMFLNIRGCSQTCETGQNCEKLCSQVNCSASEMFQSGICWYARAPLPGDAELSVICCLQPQLPIWGKKHRC